MQTRIRCLCRCPSAPGQFRIRLSLTQSLFVISFVVVAFTRPLLRISFFFALSILRLIFQTCQGIAPSLSSSLWGLSDNFSCWIVLAGHCGIPTIAQLSGASNACTGFKSCICRKMSRTFTFFFHHFLSSRCALFGPAVTSVRALKIALYSFVCGQSLGFHSTQGFKYPFCP